MTSPDTQYVDISDFSPGIMQRLMRAGSGGGPYPTGAAQVPGTHRCIALPAGGLGPLPKRNTPYVLNVPEGANATMDGQYHIVGFYTFGPIQSGSPPGSPDELHIGIEYRFMNGGTPERRFRWYRMRVFDGSNTLDTLKSINSAVGVTNVCWGMSFGTQRMNPTNVLLPGYPVVVTSWVDHGNPTVNSFVSVFPDPTSAATAATNAVKDLATGKGGVVVCHQGRVVLLEASSFRHGTPPGAAGAVPSNEPISFTDPNAMVLGTQQQIFMSEFPNGYGAWGSISAGELFLVKQQGGGVIVQGDIADPTITRLPGVVSCGNASGRGASTPMGFIYGTILNGMWVWRGADTAEKVSAALEDDFYVVPSAVVHDSERFFMAEWADWMVCSNNWLLDTGTKSWWRIEDPTIYTYLHWQRGFAGQFMYGGLPNIPSGANAVIGHDFRRDVPATNFSWLSHPLFLDQGDRETEVRELIITAQGVGTVAVTITDASDPTNTKTHTITVTNNQTVSRQRVNTKLMARAVTVKIVSDGGSTAAPLVYGVRLGHHIRMRLKAA